MLRRSVFTALGAGAAALAWGLVGSPPATGAVLEPATAGLVALKRGIVESTGYAESAVEVALRGAQIWVTIVNSKLNASSAVERAAEASGIVVTIVHVAEAHPEFAGLLGMHVDYVARNAGSDHADVIEAIDFRRTPGGSFVHHTS